MIIYSLLLSYVYFILVIFVVSFRFKKENLTVILNKEFNVHNALNVSGKKNYAWYGKDTRLDRGNQPIAKQR